MGQRVRKVQPDGRAKGCGTMPRMAGRVWAILLITDGGALSLQPDEDAQSTHEVEAEDGTKKKEAEEVLKEVRAHEKSLRKGGVRYVKYPNQAKTYNRLDLKTGETTVTDERALLCVD